MYQIPQMCTKFHTCVPKFHFNLSQCDWLKYINCQIAKITEIAKIDNIAKIGNIGVRGLTLNAERLILLKGFALCRFYVDTDRG